MEIRSRSTCAGHFVFCNRLLLINFLEPALIALDTLKEKKTLIIFIKHNCYIFEIFLFVCAKVNIYFFLILKSIERTGF